MASNYRSLKLGDHCEKIGSGATPRGGQEVYKTSGIALIRSQNVYNNFFSRDGLAFIDVDEARKLDNVTVKEGDILLNITGDSVARVCQVPYDLLPARVNQHVAIIRPDKDIFDPAYVKYWLVSPHMQSYMLQIASAGATRNALTKGMIEQFEIPTPSLPEQRAIADILCSLDDKIELNRQINATLEATAQAFFKSWFVDFDPVHAKVAGQQPSGMDADTATLFPAAFEDSELGLIPQGWRVGHLDDLVLLQRGFDLPSSQRTPGLYPIMAASGPAGTHNEFMVHGPGVTTGRSGVLGRVFFVHDDYWPLNTSLWVREFRASRQIHAYFLLSRLDFKAFNAGSAVPTLNRNHVHSLPMIVPPIELVEHFETLAMPLFQAIQHNEQETDSLIATRDALLPRLVSGQARVVDIEK